MPEPDPGVRLSDREIIAAKGVPYPPNTPLWYGVTESDRAIADAATQKALDAFDMDAAWNHLTGLAEALQAVLPKCAEPGCNNYGSYRWAETWHCDEHVDTGDSLDRVAAAALRELRKYTEYLYSEEQP